VLSGSWMDDVESETSGLWVPILLALLEACIPSPLPQETLCKCIGCNRICYS
jgi:hypothetical protein